MSGTPGSVLDGYLRVEARVRELMDRLVQPWCSTCEDPCCRKELCAESLDSTFLIELAARGGDDPGGFDEAQGWLGPRGCRLGTGRPPICTEFTCSRIDAEFGSAERVEALRDLGRIPNHLGHRALGSRHLVVLNGPTELARVKPERFERRLRDAERELERVEKVLG